MRPYTDEKLVIDYARIHRVEGEPGLFPVPNFVDDLAGLLQQAIDHGYTAAWHNHDWFLGNVEVTGTDTEPSGVSARFGWREQMEDPNVPPPYHDGQWDDAIGTTFHGTVGIFAVDGVSRRLALTCFAGGDLQTKGFCHALTNLLNDQEVALRAEDSERPGLIEWIVEPVSERGVFRNWYDSVQSRGGRVKRLAVSFHLPNPDVDPQIASVVGVLNESNSTEGSINLANKDGRSIDPYGSELVRSGLAMQERDYGAVRAVAETAQGEELPPFKTSDHIASQTVTPETPGRPSIREAGAILFETLAAWIRGHGSDA